MLMKNAGFHAGVTFDALWALYCFELARLDVEFGYGTASWLAPARRSPLPSPETFTRLGSALAPGDLGPRGAFAGLCSM
jgi:hypothetical protein